MSETVCIRHEVCVFEDALILVICVQLKDVSLKHFCPGRTMPESTSLPARVCLLEFAQSNSGKSDKHFGPVNFIAVRVCYSAV